MGYNLMINIPSTHHFTLDWQYRIYPGTKKLAMRASEGFFLLYFTLSQTSVHIRTIMITMIKLLVRVIILKGSLDVEMHLQKDIARVCVNTPSSK